jgi:hypothetical protein
MADYNYKLEMGEYVFYKDGEVLTTPHGAVIKTPIEDLAKILLSKLEANPDFTSPTNMLTYHYTYCNLNEESTTEEVAEDFANCVNCDVLMNDDYLMFNQPAPVKIAYAQHFAEELPQIFKALNLNQLVAMLVIHEVYDSWMLSYYIIAEIIQKLAESDDFEKYHIFKFRFLNNLEEYECEELGIDTDDEDYDKHREELSNTIDAFITYYILT